MSGRKVITGPTEGANAVFIRDGREESYELIAPFGDSNRYWLANPWDGRNYFNVIVDVSMADYIFVWD